MNNQYSTRVDKKSIGIFWFLLVMCVLVGLSETNFQIPSVIFWGVLITANLVLYFVKVPRGYVKESCIMDYLGVFGVSNAIALSIFLALYMGDTLLKFTIILVAFLVLIAVVVLVERKVFTVDYFENIKHKRGYVSTAVIMAGVLLGRRLVPENKGIVLPLVLGLFVFLLAFFYFYKLKAKWVALSEEKKEKPILNGWEQSGDGM